MCDVSAHAHWPPSVPLAPPGRRGQPQNRSFYLLEDARWNISIDGTVASVRDLLSRGTMGVGQEEHLVDAFLLDGLQRHPRRTLVRAEASVDVLAVPFYSDLIVGEQADGCDRDPMKRHWESLSSTPTGGGRRLAVAARCPAGGIPGSHGVRACCEAACGECGGRGCDARPGGRAACCALDIVRQAVHCSDTGAPPCVPGATRRMPPRLGERRPGRRHDWVTKQKDDGRCGQCSCNGRGYRAHIARTEAVAATLGQDDYFLRSRRPLVVIAVGHSMAQILGDGLSQLLRKREHVLLGTQDRAFGKVGDEGKIAALFQDVVELPHRATLRGSCDEAHAEPARRRSTDFFFHGSKWAADKGVRGAMRNALEHMKPSTRRDVHMGDRGELFQLSPAERSNASSRGGFDATMTADAMRSARLCMVPSGDTPTSRRLYDALAAGCVPVVMRQEQVLVLNGPPFLPTGYSKSASHSLPFPRTVNWPDVVAAYSPQYGRGQSPRDAETERNVLRGMSLNKTVWQICRSEKQRGKNESATCRNRWQGAKVTREAYANATSEGTEKCRQLEAEWLESRASANWSHQLGQRAHDAYCAHLDVEGNPLGVADAFLREVLVKAIFLEENAEKQAERQQLQTKAQTKAQKKAQKKAKKRAQLKASKKADQVAVCVTGMQARLQPEFVLSGLVAPNRARWSFHLFYALEWSARMVFSKLARIRSPAPMASFDRETLRTSLDVLGARFGAASTQLVDGERVRTRAEWERHILSHIDVTQSHSRNLNRIAQYVGYQHMILNMYQHQVDCAGAILKHERHRGSAFDYIVAVREDTYFFSPVDMDVVVRSIGEGCDLVSKECLAYDGLNMRFQLLRGSKGLAYLAGRISFYAALRPNSVKNPETFDLRHAHSLGMRTCARPVSVVPAAAARYIGNGSFCFPSREVLNLDGLDASRAELPSITIGHASIDPERQCFPETLASYVLDRVCERGVDSVKSTVKKKAPKTSPDSRNGQTVRVFSLVLFGFELQMLRLHLLQTAPHLHAVLVAESTITFQGGPKPAHLTEALARETVPMARKLRVAVVSPEELRQHCGALMQQGGYSAARCVETHQRARLFRMLFEVAAANDVALLCDVDEIAKPQTLQRLRRAPPFGPNGSAPHKVVLEAIDYKFGVHCAMRAPWTGLHAYSVEFLLRNSQNLRFLAEQGKNQIWKQPRWSAAAWHLSSFGTRAQLRQKLATWGHANLFDEHAHPGSLSEARLARCAEHCLVPDSPTVGATPSCVDGAPGNQRLPAKRIGSIAELSQLDLPPYLAHHRANFSEYFAYAVHLPRTKKKAQKKAPKKAERSVGACDPAAPATSPFRCL